ncbi:hypothetical protein ABEB36_002716 [Hypothenemus hampei]|uniref:Uncharacterized protein n=1 Tax=Hypothenemus hampei TaxID=57062 RepID=A0ABD1F9V0_HYPHA
MPMEIYDQDTMEYNILRVQPFRQDSQILKKFEATRSVQNNKANQPRILNEVVQIEILGQGTMCSTTSLRKVLKLTGVLHESVWKKPRLYENLLHLQLNSAPPHYALEIRQRSRDQRYLEKWIGRKRTIESAMRSSNLRFFL